VRSVRSLISIGFENSDLRGLILDRHGVQGQDSWLNANRSLNLLFERCFIALDLSRIDLQLGYPHDTALRFGRGVSARPEQTGNHHGCAKEQKLFHPHGDLPATDFNAKRDWRKMAHSTRASSRQTDEVRLRVDHRPFVQSSHSCDASPEITSRRTPAAMAGCGRRRRTIRVSRFAPTATPKTAGVPPHFGRAAFAARWKLDVPDLEGCVGARGGRARREERASHTRNRLCDANESKNHEGAATLERRPTSAESCV